MTLCRLNRVPGDHDNVALTGFDQRFDGLRSHLSKAQHGGFHLSSLVQQIVQRCRGETEHGLGGLCEPELLANRAVGSDHVLEKG